MIYGEKRKTVVFNLDNPDERAIFQMIEKANFSKLIKNYLLQELNRLRGNQQTNQK